MGFLNRLVRRPIVTNILIFILYVIIAKASLSFASVHPNISPVWPPTGIAIAAFLILGRNVWPAIFFGAFVADLTTAGNVLTSIFIALGSGLEGAIGGLLMRRYARGLHAFDHSQTVFYSVLAATTAPMVSATIGVSALTILGYSAWQTYPSLWGTWWLGDVTGALVITPAIVLWFAHPHKNLRGKVLELILFSITLALVSYIVFFGILPYPYLIMAVLLWVAFRFGPRETATSVILVGAFGMWATANRLGPFVQAGVVTNESFLFLQLFLAVLATTKLTISALVSERETAQEEISRRERRFRSLIEKSFDGVALIDANASILYTSPSTKNILGYETGELINTAGLSLIHPDDLDRVMRLLSNVAATPNKTIHDEFRIKRKNGAWVWVNATTTNLLHDNAVGALVLNYRDITDRKNLESAKDEFMMISAHQLRSPLASMRWNMELLLAAAKDLPAAVKTKLRLIYEYNQKLIDLVNELLDVTRIIQGKIPSEPEITDISRLIKNEINIDRPLAEKHKIKLTAKIPKTTIPSVYLDPKRFTWVIQNLLSNAIKYTESGGSISVSVTVHEADIQLAIADTGIGIPKDEQSFIFSKFFRASNARAVESEGTGLGLFAARGYILHWGGTIDVESPTLAKGKGTTITITIPIHQKRR